MASDIDSREIFIGNEEEYSQQYSKELEIQDSSNIDAATNERQMSPQLEEGPVIPSIILGSFHKEIAIEPIMSNVMVRLRNRKHNEDEREAIEIITDLNTVGVNGLKCSISEAIQKLDHYLNKCSAKREYELCNDIRKMIDYLKAENDKFLVQKMRNQQIEQKKSIMQAYNIELEDAQGKWKVRIADFQKQMKLEKEHLADKHGLELQEFTNSFHEAIRNRPPKFSKQLLNLLKVQEILAKKKDFSGALKVKKAAEKLQNEELIRLSKEHSERYEKKKAFLLLKQKQELHSLEVKLERELREIEMQRDKELNKLKKRHMNIKQTIEDENGVMESKARAFLSKRSDRKVQEMIVSEPFTNWSTYIKQDDFKSRPLYTPVPTSHNPAEFSEITRSVATSMMRFDTSPYRTRHSFPPSQVVTSNSNKGTERKESNTSH